MDEPEIRVQPHSIEAEEGVIAACLMEDGREILSDCIEAKITKDSFFKPAHGEIFGALVELFETGDPIDEILLFEHLTKKGSIEEVGGIATIYSIQHRIETNAHARYFAKIVQEKHLLRQAIRVCRKAVEGCYEGSEDFRVVLGEAESKLRAISENEDVTGGGVVHASEVVSRTTKHIQERIENPGHRDERVVPTHLSDLNSMLDPGGFGPGQVVILAARPSVGKSALMGNFAEYATVEKKIATLIFTFEMTDEEIINRMACSRAKINSKRLKKGEVRAEDQTRLAVALRDLRDAPLYIDDSSTNTILDIRAKALRKKRELERKGMRLGLVCVDYMQLIKPTNSRIPRVEQVGEISRGGKAIAKELGCPFVNLAQLNRESEKEKRDPRLSDLREAGDIEQDADVVLFLNRCPEANTDQSVNPDVEAIKLIIAKQRGGPTGDVMSTFVKQFTQFENYARDY